MSEVVLYTAPGCSLCDEAREALERLAGRGPSFAVREVDITSDPGLHRRLLERIPVVEIAGSEVCDLAVDEAKVARALATVTGL